MDVVLVRAGALGDVLLLRRAVAGLRAAGHRVRLVAPAGPGAALVGPGPSEVEALLAWAPEHGITRVEGAFWSTNPRAGELYQRLGFEVEGVQRRAILRDGVAADAILVARLL